MPKIELASLPGLDGAQALYGSLSQNAASGDPIVDIMVFLYDNLPPPPPETLALI